MNHMIQNECWIIMSSAMNRLRTASGSPSPSWKSSHSATSMCVHGAVSTRSSVVCNVERTNSCARYDRDMPEIARDAPEIARDVAEIARDVAEITRAVPEIACEARRTRALT